MPQSSNNNPIGQDAVVAHFLHESPGQQQKTLRDLIDSCPGSDEDIPRLAHLPEGHRENIASYLDTSALKALWDASLSCRRAIIGAICLRRTFSFHEGQFAQFHQVIKVSNSTLMRSMTVHDLPELVEFLWGQRGAKCFPNLKRLCLCGKMPFIPIRSPFEIPAFGVHTTCDTFKEAMEVAIVFNVNYLALGLSGGYQGLPVHEHTDMLLIPLPSTLTRLRFTCAFNSNVFNQSNYIIGDLIEENKNHLEVLAFLNVGTHNVVVMDAFTEVMLTISNGGLPRLHQLEILQFKPFFDNELFVDKIASEVLSIHSITVPLEVMLS
ncbi:hypothetical protein T439DRAFT_384442 [Meredithblackwellia eburnea MCA 4105]